MLGTEADVGTDGGGLIASPDEVAAVARLAAAVEVVGAVDLSSLSDQQLDAHLGRLRQPIAALEAARSRAFAEFEGRAAPQENPARRNAERRERRFRMTDTPDGGVAFSGLAYGIAAELARNALDAFRRPDAADEHRTPEQRSADAFEQLCDAALRLGDAPTVHGERPQVTLVVEEAELQREAGSAVFAGSGQPITLAEAGTLLTDRAVSSVVRRADSTPIEVTRNVRTVPQGLWRALVVRDGGCRWEGCDAPASWCDVAHGEHPYRAEGHLSPENALLLCTRHHRRFDKGPWRVEIVGDEVTFHREESPYVHPLDRAALAAEADAREQRQRGDPAGAAAPADQARAGPSTDEARAGPSTDEARAGQVPVDPVRSASGATASPPPGVEQLRLDPS